MIPRVVFVPAAAPQNKFFSPENYPEVLGVYQRQYALPALRKHTTGFLVKSFGDCCGGRCCSWLHRLELLRQAEAKDGSPGYYL